MLKDYLKMLEDAFCAMSNLNSENASMMDYFNVVKYEFLVVLLGIAYLVLIVGIFVVPIVFYIKTYCKYESNPVWEKYQEDKEYYNDFQRIYNNLKKELYDAKPKRQKELYEKICEMLKSKNISYKSPIVLTDYVEATKMLPKLELIWSGDKVDLPGDFKPLGTPDKYLSFSIMRNINNIIGWSKAIAFTIVYVILVVPLVLMVF